MTGHAPSTLLVRVEDMVLRLHFHMARVSAVRDAGGIGRPLVSCGVVVEQGVAPSAAVRSGEPQRIVDTEVSAIAQPYLTCNRVRVPF